MHKIKIVETGCRNTEFRKAFQLYLKKFLHSNEVVIDIVIYRRVDVAIFPNSGIETLFSAFTVTGLE